MANKTVEKYYTRGMDTRECGFFTENFLVEERSRQNHGEQLLKKKLTVRYPRKCRSRPPTLASSET